MALRRDGDRRLHDLRARPGPGRRVAGQPLPRRRLRRAVLPLLVHATSSAATGRGRARRSRRSWTTCTRSRTSTGVGRRIRTDTEIASAEFDEAAGAGGCAPPAGEEHEAEALVVACGQLSRPSWPVDPRPRRVRRPRVPLGRVGPRLRPGGQARGGDRHRRQRGAVRAAGGRAGRRSWTCTSARRRGCCRAATSEYPRWGRWLLRHVPGLQALRRRYLLDGDGVDDPGPDQGAAAALAAGRMGPDVHAPPAARPRAAAQAVARLPDRLQARAVQQPLPARAAARRTWRWSPTRSSASRRPAWWPAGASARWTASSGAPASRPASSCCPMRVTGREGRELQETWSGGAEAHLGIAVAGFPSMYLLYGPNTNLGVGSIIEMIEAQVRYVSGALRGHARRGRAAGPAARGAALVGRAGPGPAARLDLDRVRQLVPPGRRGPRGQQLARLHGRVPQAHARVRSVRVRRSIGEWDQGTGPRPRGPLPRRRRHLEPALAVGRARPELRVHGRGGGGRADRQLGRAALRRGAHAHRHRLDRPGAGRDHAGRAAAVGQLHLRPQAVGDPERAAQRRARCWCWRRGWPSRRWAA